VFGGSPVRLFEIPMQAEGTPPHRSRRMLQSGLWLPKCSSIPPHPAFIIGMRGEHDHLARMTNVEWPQGTEPSGPLPH
jgi:hypothetical protein